MLLLEFIAWDTESAPSSWSMSEKHSVDWLIESLYVCGVTPPLSSFPEGKTCFELKRWGLHKQTAVVVLAVTLVLH